MKITEVRIYRTDEQHDQKLRAYATLTIDDCFVVRDIKIIQGSKGLFVAMPSRRVKESCPQCENRNIIGSNYCNRCGTNLREFARSSEAHEAHDPSTRQSEHRDIAHPVTAECRQYIQSAVLEAYEHETVK